MKEFIKNKYNVLIPVFLLIVLLLAVFLYAKEYKNNRYAEVKEVEVYQYFSGVKMDYVAKISRNKSNVILEYENNDYAVSFDSTPVYIKDKDNVIFPKEMSIVLPLKNIQYRVNALAEIYMENDLYYLNIRNMNRKFEHVFYFDGKNLYFFTDSVTLKVGEETIELSPMSYVSCSFGNFVEYYDKGNDSYGMIELSNESVVVSNEFMSIDVAMDKVIYKDNFMLLTSDFTYLNKITDMEE